MKLPIETRSIRQEKTYLFGSSGTWNSFYGDLRTFHCSLIPKWLFLIINSSKQQNYFSKNNPSQNTKLLTLKTIGVYRCRLLKKFFALTVGPFSQGTPTVGLQSSASQQYHSWHASRCLRNCITHSDRSGLISVP